MVPVVVFVCACVTVRNVRVESIPRPAVPSDSVTIRSPVKAHLLDGSTVVYPDGARVQRDTVWGRGTHYDLTLRDSLRIDVLPLDRVVGMEAFLPYRDTGQSVLLSTLAAAGTVIGSVAILKAIFGSCPTFYSDSTLQAEGFSYSIAPLFEARDVDRMVLQVGDGGRVRVEVRNEALETHFINHLELLEVRHAPDEMALPDGAHLPVLVGGLRAPARAVDRTGRSVLNDLAEGDGRIYRTAARVLAHATVNDLDDWIELAAPRLPAAGDSVALVFRLRNSLLNTVLLYDVMLGDPGARSLDWIGRDLQRIGPAVELGQWYRRRMGMDVAVWDGAAWHSVVRLGDTGPIAWKDVALIVPALEPDSLRIRLRFPADNWRIDRVAVGGRFRRAIPEVHPIAAVRDAGVRLDAPGLASLVAADARYLETSPGQWFAAEFDVAPDVAPAQRTFLLASQGYYIEWVRQRWLRDPVTTRTFVPSESALADAIARWSVAQDSMEARFMATRIPVR